jgi:hypothetical protein
VHIASTSPIISDEQLGAARELLFGLATDMEQVHWSGARDTFSRITHGDQIMQHQY